METKEQRANIAWNQQSHVRKKIAAITDKYFREKLESGLIKYDPDEWTCMDPIEENELR